jgi:hypothetical protein
VEHIASIFRVRDYTEQKTSVKSGRKQKLLKLFSCYHAHVNNSPVIIYADMKTLYSFGCYFRLHYQERRIQVSAADKKLLCWFSLQQSRILWT